MRLLITSLFVLSILAVNAQKTETRSVSEFYDINIQGPFKVKLKNSKDNAIRIETDIIPLEEIISEVRGKELVLKLRSRVYLKEKYFDTDYIYVELDYSEIEEIKVSMGSIVRIDDPLIQEYLRVEASMGGEARLDIEVEDFYAKASMGGILHISGSADYAEISASMGAEVFGSMLSTKKADVSSGMGGFVAIQADDLLEGSASMGGVIRYSGDPARKNTSTILGGEIRRSKKNN